MFIAPATLPDDPPTLHLILRAALAGIERLRLLLAGLRRNRFGRRSEQPGEETLQRGIEDLEQVVAEQQAGLEAALPPAEAPAAPPDPEVTPTPPRTRPAAKRNRGALPAHLPRIELLVDVEDTACSWGASGSLGSVLQWAVLTLIELPLARSVDPRDPYASQDNAG